jgi:hypothetical protein
VLRFYRDLASRLPDLLWISAGLLEKIIGVVSLCLSVFGVTAWWPFSPLWAFLPLVLFVLYGLMKANYEKFQEEEQKRKQVEAEIARLEKKLASERKRKAVMDLLGDAQEEGESLKQGKTYDLKDENPDKEDDELLDEYHAKREREERAWVNRTYNLIHAAFSKAEAQRFISNEGLTEEEMFGRKMRRSFYLTFDQRKYLIPARLKRLDGVIDRANSLPINPDFDPQDWA